MTLERNIIVAINTLHKTNLTYISHTLFQNGMGGEIKAKDQNGKIRSICFNQYDKYRGHWTMPVMAESVYYFGQNKWCYEPVADCDYYIMVNTDETYGIIAKREAFDESNARPLGGKYCFTTKNYKEIDLND